MNIPFPVLVYLCNVLFLSLFRESLLFALHALRVNRLRTILSLLGITIGIFAIIAVFTAVDSMENKIRNSVQSLGDNVVYIQKWPWTPEGGQEYAWWKYMNRPVPKVSESDELRRRLSSAEAVVYMASANGMVRYGTSFVENAGTVCATYDYYKVKGFDIASGRYFTEQECETGKAVCIIGNNIAKALFTNDEPLGKDIKIRDRRVKVIGVFKAEGESIIGNSSDDQLLIPLDFARTMVDVENDRIDPSILVRAAAGVQVQNLKAELTGAMRSIRRLKPVEENNFAANEVSLLSAPMEAMFGVIGIAGWLIGAFSILVGGFGIANIMFVSVRERTSQIGIQKSLGAKSWFILMQFLAESVVLCLLGGIIGLLLDGLMVYTANQFIDFGFVLSLENISLGITISVLIGIISGFIPAYSAAQLDPVEAIRSNA
ncbi:MAG TPA: ABC transporter permease [Bacteroidia bacterium]|nr:ABC transporter permease [Bacteroidia bacterium]